MAGFGWGAYSTPGTTVVAANQAVLADRVRGQRPGEPVGRGEQNPCRDQVPRPQRRRPKLTVPVRLVRPVSGGPSASYMRTSQHVHAEDAEPGREGQREQR